MPDDEGLLDQSEIEALFSSMGGEGSAPAPASSKPAAKPAPKSKPTAVAEAPAMPGDLTVQPFQLSELQSGEAGGHGEDDLSLIYDVDLNVRIELGRTRMYIQDVLRLREGSVVPLDKLAGDPVDVYVNGQLLARGEVLVLNDNFCVRISEIISEGLAEGKAS